MNIADLLEHIFVNADAAESITFLKDEQTGQVVIRMAAPLNGKRLVTEARLHLQTIHKCRVNQDDGPILEAIKLTHEALRNGLEDEPDDDCEATLEGAWIEHGDPRPRPEHINPTGYVSHFSAAAQAQARLAMALGNITADDVRRALGLARDSLQKPKPKPPEPDPDDTLDTPPPTAEPKQVIPVVPLSQVRLDLDTSRIKLGPVMKPPIRDSPRPDDKPPFVQHD